MFEAIKTGKGFKGTLEFFPEEGKYFYDGYRNCGVCMSPPETIAQQGFCRVCGKPVTIGVMLRVLLLADRKEPVKPNRAADFEYIIPLPEILSELHEAGVESKRVTAAFIEAINFAGSEFSLLKEMPLETIHTYKPRPAEAIQRMRSGNVQRIPGYDGVYGSIRLFEDEKEVINKGLQGSLF